MRGLLVVRVGRAGAVLDVEKVKSRGFGGRVGRVEDWIWSGGFHSPYDILGSFNSEDAVPAVVVKTGPVISLKAWLSV